jgi:hypothetical protein
VKRLNIALVELEGEIEEAKCNSIADIRLSSRRIHVDNGFTGRREDHQPCMIRFPFPECWTILDVEHDK